MPPFTNATVTKVTGSGKPDDWDRAGAGGADKWTGELRAYYVEKLDRRIADGEATVLTVRTLYIDTAAFDELGLDTDDLITFRRDGQAETVSAAADVARTNSPALTPPINTTRINLKQQ